MAAGSLRAKPGEAVWRCKPVELSEAVVARSQCAAQRKAAGSGEEMAAKLSCVKSSEVMESSEVTAADKSERWSVDGGGDVCRNCRGCQGASNDGAGGAGGGGDGGCAGGVPKVRLVARAI